MAEALRGGAGGIGGLHRFLEEYGEAVEWDLARYWPGRSLLELYRGEMSWRELRVFLRFLPPESATARAINPDSAWTLDRHLQAAVADNTAFLNALTIYVNSDPKKRGRFKPPDPITRPGVEPRREKSNVIKFGGRHGSGARQLATVFGGASG
ncbi:hypothetical protein [Streptomyces candidus]|uniref:Uncharacterized protein n=1 Tax=Streptomyces candidus TaxID=67283 RepID=A0A7X0HPG3_9ACTN|nr:hypothetical protein [Streptomyces candidus]MBB6439913.1 hypothetical protein [Streptomyces candidus]GHH57905.1 hypothetical protein GCM10018773_65860 [Streptomyces candidus]